MLPTMTLIENGASLVTTDRLTVTYGTTVAVDEITFHVDAGEVFGLLGPNAAGKTSVIRALTTILRPSGGSATVAGAPLDDPDTIRANIGVLPESNGYPGSQSAAHYLTFYGQLFGLSSAAARDRSLDLLDRFGLASNSYQEIRTFSRGMRQRLGIARALINRPRVLFLDEPTIGLDPAGREDVLSHLVSVAQESGSAVLICSHLLDDIERICDRVAILHHGRLAAEGTVAEVSASSGVTSNVLLEVSPDQVQEVVAVLNASNLDCRPIPNPSRRGEIRIDLTDEMRSANPLARILVDQQISILRLEMRTSRLSDAFLAHTAEEEG